METRRLGRSALQVSAIGLGCMGLSGVYGPADDAESTTLIQRAIEPGEVVSRDDVDAVVLALPPQYHTEYAIRAVEAGKHVLVEKPMARTAAEAITAVKDGQDFGKIVLTR